MAEGFKARVLRVVLMVIAAGWAGAVPVIAHAEDGVFVVARVPVQARADSATNAKDIAQSQGRRRAVDILLRRITPEQDWVYLPKLANGQAPQAAASGGAKRPIYLSEADVVDLESSFEVYDEKSSSRLYRAFITYRFKPNAIRGLLKRAGLPYSEAQTRTALVLPVLQTDAGVYLWESNNPWMAAWRARPYTHELTPMRAPPGNSQDRALISAKDALNIERGSLAAIAGRYGVSQVIVAHARLKQMDGTDQVRVRLINGYRETARSEDAAASSLEDLLGSAGSSASGTGSNIAGVGKSGAASNTANRRIGPKHSGDLYGYRPPPDEDFAADVGEVLASAYASEPSGNFPMLAERLIESSIAKYASSWKELTLIDHASDTRLSATAFFDSLDDWSRIRDALIATPLVGAVRIAALSPKGAEMEVRVFGDPQRLQVALENQGIVFWTETGGRWFLATPSVSSRFRGQRFLREGDRGGIFGADPRNRDAEKGFAAGASPAPMFEPTSTPVSVQ
ncbi:MAG: DUF2066 domain-containing protein [Pseudomonadota bacterium]